MGPKPRLAHVVLQTAQPDVLCEWYCKLLEGHVVYSGHGLAFVTFDEEHHRVAFKSSRPPSTLWKSPRDLLKAAEHDCEIAVGIASELELDCYALCGNRQDVALYDLAMSRVVPVGEEAGLVVEVG